MDISSGFFMDLLLNLIGYLTAGALVWTIYPIVKPWLERHPVAFLQPEVQPKQPRLVKQPASEPQFMHLKNSTEKARPVMASDNKPTKKSLVLRSSERQDRVNIIKIAREMLKAGADNKRIQQVLPVSEAELALLTMQNQ